ncbi:ABC transporter permease [Bacillus testis]|uniref:ABC transporter permease n=1 Tax=Bacillus testis TaxID=1622072 RepID=UPI00067F6935|nr:ABC transporter permease [Bacillus testis]
MAGAIFNAIEAGVIYAIMALGVYLSFRILDFPDLTVDGSFVTGAGTAAIMIVNGHNPIIATIVAACAGFLAGSITGILHTKGKINPLLSGILMMIALYSINLRIMGRSNVPLLTEDTVISKIRDSWNSSSLNGAVGSLLDSAGLQGILPSSWGVLLSMLVVTLLIKCVIDAFLKTEVGLAIRATGDNENMIHSFSANTSNMKILGLGISNGLVALSGALIAQYGGFSDVGMGIGMIVIGLASVIIGEAVFGSRSIMRATFAVVGGAIIYRIVVTLAMQANFLDTGDMKLITAIIVIIALILPKIIDKQKERNRKQKRLKELHLKSDMGSTTGGDHIATIKADL